LLSKPVPYFTMLSTFLFVLSFRKGAVLRVTIHMKEEGRAAALPSDRTGVEKDRDQSLLQAQTDLTRNTGVNSAPEKLKK
jgi:hypothetical protein